MRHKWQGFGKTSFYIILGLYFLFLTSLTTYILTSPNPVTHPQFYNCSEFFRNQSGNNNNDSTFVVPEEMFGNTNNVSRIAVLVLVGLYIIRFIYQGSFFILIKVLFYFFLDAIASLGVFE